MGEYGLEEVEDKLFAREIERRFGELVRRRQQMRETFVEGCRAHYNSPSRRLARFIRRCFGKPVKGYNQYMREVEAIADQVWEKL